MKYKDINQRFIDTRDQMWGRSMMGRHSTLADRPASFPQEKVEMRWRVPRSTAPSLWSRWKWALGNILIWLGQHLEAKGAKPQEPVLK